jgi:type I restriction enzyme S subunit
MEKYNKYKDSSIEWVGVIPKHWEVKRIKDVFNKLGSGTTPKSSNKSYYEEGDVNWLNTTDLKNNLIFDTKLKITQKALNEFGLKIYPINSIAIAMYGQGKTRGSVGLLQVPTTTNQASCIMTKPKKDIDTKFILYWFISKYTDIRSINVGATQPNMNQDFVRFLILQKPPLKEQTQIANYLDAKTTVIDKKVNLLQQKIKHYKAYRKTLINKTVTKGLDKTVKLKDSGISWIGEIPKHWEVKRYKSFGKTIKGKNMEMSDLEFDNSLPLLSLEYLRNDSVQHPTFCYSKDKSLKSTDEDLIIVWDGAAVGEILKSKVGYVSSTIAKLDINKKKFNTRYFYHLRGAIDYKLKQIPTGMGIPHLNPTLFKNFKCPSPPIKEQQQIADYLDAKTSTIDKIVKNIETQIAILKELRKTLINEVVTGKVKVSA